MTKEIKLTQGKITLVDDVDYAFLSQYKWHVSRMGTHNNYYAGRYVRVLESKGTFISMHRVILNASKGVEVDHRNSDGLDNRRSNLRLCTPSQNTMHQGLNPRNKIGLKGVTFLKQKPYKPYRTQVCANKKQIHVGYYHTAEIAARAYDMAALKYHGEFALTNNMLGLL